MSANGVGIRNRIHTNTYIPTIIFAYKRTTIHTHFHARMHMAWPQAHVAHGSVAFDSIESGLLTQLNRAPFLTEALGIIGHGPTTTRTSITTTTPEPPTATRFTTTRIRAYVKVSVKAAAAAAAIPYSYKGASSSIVFAAALKACTSPSATFTSGPTPASDQTWTACASPLAAEQQVRLAASRTNPLPLQIACTSFSASSSVSSSASSS